MSNICPVCNYKHLQQKAYDPDGYGSYEICVCCGFQFGLDNFDYSTNEEAHIEFRKKWIEGGYKWFSKYTLAPLDWDGRGQVENSEEK